MTATQKPAPGTNPPGRPSRRAKWLLGLAVTAVVAWIVFLLVLAVDSAR